MIRIAWTGVWYTVKRSGNQLGLVWRRKKDGEWVAIDGNRLGVQTKSFLKAARFLTRDGR